MMTSTRRITHVIYDLDGTLLDTEPLYVQATNDLLAPFGVALDPAIRALMMGRPTPVAVPILIEATGIPMTAEEFVRARDSRLLPLYASAPPMRGALELTRHLHGRGVPQAVATSSTRVTLASKRSGHPEWFEMFGAIVTSEDVVHGKPAPDIFLEAARRLGAPPESCLVFEDAPIGVEAALAAGMTVIAIPEDGHADLVRDAHGVIESLADFRPEQWGLPPYPHLP
jgi:HAD superfamily hydrolase (TIGR01509 family)